jgi:drug/metabolite transporter (DMT)-like permease
MGKSVLSRYSADIGMGTAVTIWGLHFIVVKDALDTLSPATFNALRIAIGLVVLLALSRGRHADLRIAPRDVPRLVVPGLCGQFAHQLFFILGLRHTTSTNTALLIATAPTWIALFSVALGITLLNRALILGVFMTLAGVMFVTLGQSGAGLSISSSDLLGISFALGSALALAGYNIGVKPLMDRYGGLPVVIWVFVSTLVGLLIAAAPNLVTLHAADLTPRIWLSLFYSGAFSAALGYMLETRALRSLGSARAGTYYNFMPVVAAVAGILLLGEPLTLFIALGGFLVLSGVIVVRRHTLLRPTDSPPVPEPAPLPAGY